MQMRTSMTPRRIEVTIGDVTFDAVFTPPNKVTIRDASVLDELFNQAFNDEHVRKIVREEISNILGIARDKINREKS